MYNVKTIIPIKINKQNPRIILHDEIENIQKHKEKLDLLSEIRKKTRIRKKTLKRRTTLRYNQKIIKRNFSIHDLILIRNNIGTHKSKEKKLAA
ncbi:hypothetical protein DF186_15100, partial [Enterococcus hirae]